MFCFLPRGCKQLPANLELLGIGRLAVRRVFLKRIDQKKYAPSARGILLTCKLDFIPLINYILCFNFTLTVTISNKWSDKSLIINNNG